MNLLLHFSWIASLNFFLLFSWIAYLILLLRFSWIAYMNNFLLFSWIAYMNNFLLFSWLHEYFFIFQLITWIISYVSVDYMNNFLRFSWLPESFLTFQLITWNISYFSVELLTWIISYFSVHYLKHFLLFSWIAYLLLRCILESKSGPTRKGRWWPIFRCPSRPRFERCPGELSKNRTKIRAGRKVFQTASSENISVSEIKKRKYKKRTFLKNIIYPCNCEYSVNQFYSLNKRIMNLVLSLNLFVINWILKFLNVFHKQYFLYMEIFENNKSCNVLNFFYSDRFYVSLFLNCELLKWNDNNINILRLSEEQFL